MRRRPLLTLAVLAAVIMSGTWALRHAARAVVDQEVPDPRGGALWRGELPLTAHIVGHARALPAAASRCVNCHAVAPVAPAGSAVLAARDSAAPVLSAAQLRATVPRRGGPPSRYDAQAFCTLLRTGVDPAGVLLSRDMPRYTLDPRDCQALWTHLTGSGT